MYVYVCVYESILIERETHAKKRACVHLCMYVCLCMYASVWCACAFACISACSCACVCVCVCSSGCAVCGYIRIYVCAYEYFFIGTMTDLFFMCVHVCATGGLVNSPK